jgi:hypothetical protein
MNPSMIGVDSCSLSELIGHTLSRYTQVREAPTSPKLCNTSVTLTSAHPCDTRTVHHPDWEASILIGCTLTPHLKTRSPLGRKISIQNPKTLKF